MDIHVPTEKTKDENFQKSRFILPPSTFHYLNIKLTARSLLTLKMKYPSISNHKGFLNI